MEGWQNGNAPVSKTGVRKDLEVRFLYPPPMFYVYILICSDGKTYIGCTNEYKPINQLNQHPVLVGFATVSLTKNEFL